MITKIFNIKSIVSYNPDSDNIIVEDIDFIIVEDRRILNINTLNKDLIVDYEIDAKQTLITPGFIDSHTHLIFSSNRSKDFLSRVSGKSYFDIAESGGGIKTSIESLRNATKEELVDKCLKDINNIIKTGTTTIEAKSGYGLTLKDEIKSLEVIKKLNEMSIVDIVPTFMGAHDFPPEAIERNSYIDLICSEMIPEISRNKLAEFCDIFCEEGYFNHNQTKRIANIAKSNNLKIKLHVDEFKDSDGAYLAGELNAVSADHLMKSNIAIHTVSDSGHFPMMDNPKEVYEVICKVVEDVF